MQNDRKETENETLTVIARRRSVRAFTDEPVSKAHRQAVLGAMRRAPTAGNMMLYSVIEVTSPEKKAYLADSCDNQPWIATAPLVLVFLADQQRWADLYEHAGAQAAAERAGVATREPGMGDLFIAASDALIAAQNAVLAAESLGLSSCYVGDILENYEEHRKLLDLPPLAMPITMLCVGHAKKRARAGEPTPRLPEEAVVFQDRYRRLSGKELDAAFEGHRRYSFGEGKFMPGAANLGQHYYLRKVTAPFSLEMDRSVRAALTAWDHPRSADSQRSDGRRDGGSK